LSITEPVFIRGSGAAYTAAVWITAAATVLFLLDAAKAAHQRDASMIAIWLAGAALFAFLFIETVTVRVVLTGDEILYGSLFRTTRALRLCDIRTARCRARSGYRGSMVHYLVIEPLDQQTSSISIHTNLFSRADVQTMRKFLGEKLQRR
jgi:hypothetical protein